LQCSYAGGETSLDIGDADMKIEARMRRQILARLAAALLLAGAAGARAAVDAKSDAAQRSSVAQNGDAPSLANGDFSGESVIQEESAMTQLTKEESELARVAVIDTSLLGIVLAWMGLIVAYAMVATRRQLRPVLRNRVAGVAYGPASGVTSR
jgi:hypothetical protein